MFAKVPKQYVTLTHFCLCLACTQQNRCNCIILLQVRDGDGFGASLSACPKLQRSNSYKVCWDKRMLTLAALIQQHKCLQQLKLALRLISCNHMVMHDAHTILLMHKTCKS